MDTVVAILEGIAGLLFISFYLWTLIHLIRNKRLDSWHKFLWLIGIGWTFGIAYYFYQIRPERTKKD